MEKKRETIQSRLYKDATEIAFLCILSLELYKCQGTFRAAEAKVL